MKTWRRKPATSWTFGFIVQPRWIPGLSLSVDYYRHQYREHHRRPQRPDDHQPVRRRSGRHRQSVCDVVFRRTGTGNPLTDFAFDGQSTPAFLRQPHAGARRHAITDLPLPVLGPGFLNQPFNFAAAEDVGHRRGPQLPHQSHRHDPAQPAGDRQLGRESRAVRIDHRARSVDAPPQHSGRSGMAGRPVGQRRFRPVGRQLQRPLCRQADPLRLLAYDTFFGGRASARPIRTPGRSSSTIRSSTTVPGSTSIPTSDCASMSASTTSPTSCRRSTWPESKPARAPSAPPIYPNTGRFFYAGAELRF